MEPLSLKTISDYAEGKQLCGGASITALGVNTDSRSVTPGDLFVALRGDRFDGHEFVAASAQKGAVGALVDAHYVRTTLPPEFALIEVDDTLLGYQRLAARHRRSLSIEVVAITGSNGKTSTKDFTAAVLDRRFRVIKTEGNLNNHIGVPRTLLTADADDQVMVLEIGMNHPGEIAPLAAMADPNVAVITNIGTAHLEYMKTRDAIAHEKSALAAAVGEDGHVVFPAEDEYAAHIAARSVGHTYTVGFDRGDLRAENIVQGTAGSRFEMVSENERAEAFLPVPGRHMVLNALLAAAVGQTRGLSLDECAAGLAEAQLTRSRLELKTVRSWQFLDDSYNANPESMIAALETLARMPTRGRRIAMLGKMGELGEASLHGYQRVGGAAANEKIDQVIGVGPETEALVERARKDGVSNSLSVADVAQAARWLQDYAQPDDLILIKGSRSARMERILKLLTP